MATMAGLRMPIFDVLWQQPPPGIDSQPLRITEWTMARKSRGLHSTTMHISTAYPICTNHRRVVIRFCRTNAYIYSTVGISTKISHQPIFIVSLRHFSSSPWWIDLLSSTVRSSMSMMTGNKPRYLRHLHLSISWFAEALRYYFCCYYIVEVCIDPSHNMCNIDAPSGFMWRSSL